MPVGYTQNNSNNIDYRSNDKKDDTVGLGGREKIEKRELIILKSVKTRQKEKKKEKKKMMMIKIWFRYTMNNEVFK